MEKQLLDTVQLPYSQDSEYAVIGAIINSNSAYYTASEIVTADEFYLSECREIFSAIEELSQDGKSFDAFLLSDYLDRKGVLEAIGGMKTLLHIASSFLSSANVAGYAEVIHDKYVRRQLISFAQRALQEGLSPSGMTAEELLAKQEAELMAISEGSSSAKQDFQPFNDVIKDVTNRLVSLWSDETGEASGIQTYYPNLDKVTSGLQRGDLVIVAGRPSMGKTTFAVNIAENIACRARSPVAIFSMEMSAPQLANRIVSSQGRISSSVLRTGKLTDEEWERFSETVQRIEQAPIFIDDSSNLSISELTNRARRLARRIGPLSLIVVDYIQLMKGSRTKQNENRVNELSEISRGLKALAKEMDCPVIALSQLNRSVDARTDKRPMMSDLRESGAIEQDADMIMFIYRDSVYNPESDPKRAEVLVRKHRNGSIGTLMMSFTGEYTRFETWAGEVGYSQMVE